MTPPPPPDEQDSSRLLLAIAISLAILLGFHFMYEKPRQEKMLQAQRAAALTPTTAAGSATENKPLKPRQEAIAATQRVPIHSGELSGSLSLVGAKIDDLLLNEHYATIEKKERVARLSPPNTKDAYYVESGWTSDDKSLRLPDSETVWSLAPGSAAVLAPGNTVSMQWNNGQGLLFTRKIELDDNYLFTITQEITNRTSSEKKFNAWHLISRHNLPEDFKGFFILHEGPLGFLDGKLRDPQYKDLVKGEKVEIENTHGWLGITDKYWFVGILPNPQEQFDA
ncbi:MAG: membrane protein insertase YidC, partial [Proteobacteria bacterium]|nr:membrane protein insertase YidC [Pseudomonadota bacterium]